MVLRNFIQLETGVPAVMHFVNDRLVPRQIVDPQTRQEKVINILEFDVDELNGSPTSAPFSVTSEKLAQALEPFRQGRRYLGLDIIITRTGSGFQTEYEIQTRPRA